MVEIMMNEDDDSLDEFMLMESESDEVVAQLEGDTTLFNYLLLFEEFLETHDLYLFKGWDNASIIGAPEVEKFWVVIKLLVGEGTDLRAVKRIDNALGQGTAKSHDAGNGKHIVVFNILKRDLDAIEETNKNRIDKLSDEALGEL
jgi:hypothetical protein